MTIRVLLAAVLVLGLFLFGCPFDADDPSGDAGVVVLDGSGDVTGVSIDGSTKIWIESVAGGAHGDLLVNGGLVFAASEDDQVVAFDGDDGTPLWTASIGGTARGRMTILGDVLYVQTADEVVALDADSGGEMWASPYLLSGLSGSMATGEGALYCGGKPTTVRLDPDTGDLLHEYANDESNAEVVVTGGYAVIGGAETVVGLAATDLTWDWEYALDNTSVTGMFADFGDIFVSTDADGILAFDSGVDDPFLHELEGVALDTPYIADGAIYVTESYGSLYALDVSNGAEIWAWHENNTSDPSAGVRVLGNTVYLALGSGLVGLDADSGTPEWELGTEDTILDIEVL